MSQSNARRAVIDLGTNTFHLLIADLSAKKLTAVYRERIFVKLASDGIERIGPAPFARGIEALKHFRRVLDEYEVTELHACGTAALRTATNGEVFVRQAEVEGGIPVRLISGEQEATFITHGVLAALPPLTERILIMDIGGGSTEFIIASAEGVHWRHSFAVGVAVLFGHFHHNDPITEGEVREVLDFLTVQLKPLRDALEEYPAHHLGGAAGTFDVLAEILRDEKATPHPTSHLLNLEGLDEFYFQILSSNRAERLAMPGIPETRVDMIVVAMILLRHVIGLAGIERITVSDYAMKEGILLAASASDRNPE